jgi:cytochrome c556
MRRGKLTVVVLAAGLGVGVVASAAVAVAQQNQQNPGVVGVRQNTMRAQAGHMGAMQKILAEYPQLLSHVEAHAQAIAATSSHTAEMFPPGSDKDGSKATPAAWSDPEGLKQAGLRAADLATKVAEAAKGGDAQATLAAFGALGKNGCGGCHETYRQKQQS